MKKSVFRFVMSMRICLGKIINYRMSKGAMPNVIKLSIFIKNARPFPKMDGLIFIQIIVPFNKLKNSLAGTEK